MEHEAERLDLPDRRLQFGLGSQPLDGPARPQRSTIQATREVVQVPASGPEPRQHRRARQRGELADARQPEQPQPIARLGVCGKQLDGEWRQPLRLDRRATDRDRLECEVTAAAGGRGTPPATRHRSADHGRDLRPESSIPDARPRRPGQDRGDRIDYPRRQPRLIAPQSTEALDAQEGLPEGRTRRLDLAFDRWREGGQCLERPFEDRPIRRQIDRQEDRLRDQVVRRAERLVAVDPEPLRRRAAVEHRPRIPGLSAEHDELGQRRAANGFEPKGKMRPIEIEEAQSRSPAREPMGRHPSFALGGVMDLQRHVPAGRPEPVLGHGHARLLADHVAPEADPRLPFELEAQAGHLGQGAVQATGQRRRLQDDEPGTDPLGMGRQPADGALLAGGETDGQVDGEEVDRSTRQQGAGQREALGRVGRADDEEPAQVDAARHGIDGVEGAGEIEPRRDGALGLGLRDASEGERRLAARQVTADGRTRLPGETAGAEGGVQIGEAGRDDVVAEWLERIVARPRVRAGIRFWVEGGGKRKRAEGQRATCLTAGCRRVVRWRHVARCRQVAR